jgi:hypothetical protein
MSADSGPGNREVAYRVFAAEFDDSTVSHSESDEERAPNYVITPTGGRVNRVFLVGVLTEVERVGGEQLRARVVDPTGAFVAYAGQYQPDELAFLDRVDPPAFLAITGKARTFSPEDSDRVYTSVRPESISEVDAETRDRWVVSTAEQTLDRVSTMASALRSGLHGEALRDQLIEADIDPGLASGTSLAVEHYGTSSAYLQALRGTALDALRVVAGERDEVDRLDLAPDEGDTESAVLAGLAGLDLGSSTGGGAENAEGSGPATGSRAGESAAASAPEGAGPETDGEGTTVTGGSDTGSAGAEDTVVGSGTEADPGAGSGSESADGIDPETEVDSGAEAEVEAEPTEAESTGSEPTGAAESGPEPEPQTAAATDPGTEAEPGTGDTQTGPEKADADTAETSAGTESEPVGTDETGKVEEAEESMADDEEFEDFEPGEFEVPEAEREEIEEEFGTEFETAGEVGPAGEAGIETPEPESEPSPEESQSPTADEGTAASADAEPEPEPTGQTEPADDESDDIDVEADDVDVDEATVGAIAELDDGDGADRDAVISTVVDRHGIDPEAVDEAIENAMMSGRAYEPSDGNLKAI